MPEVLLTYQSVVQETYETMESDLNDFVTEGQFLPDAEANEDGDLRQDEIVEQPEDHVYNVSHGDGQKHSGTIEQAMEDCPAMRGKSRDEVRQIMDKRVAADRVVQRMREKKRAEAAEKAKASTTEQTTRTSGREQAKEREAGQDMKPAQGSNVPAKERTEGAPAAAAKASEVIISYLNPHDIPEKPVKSIAPEIVHEQNNDETESMTSPSAHARDGTEADPAVAHSRADSGIPLGDESPARQLAPASTREDTRLIAEPEVSRLLVDIALVADRAQLDAQGPQVVELPGTRLVKDVAPWNVDRWVADTAALHVDALAVEPTRFGPDFEMIDSETTALSADELRQLFGIREYGVEEGAESVLESEVTEIRQAFIAAGHDGGESLEDLVALDAELDEQALDDEYIMELPMVGLNALQPEGAAFHDLTHDALEIGEDASEPIILPEVHPEFIETSVDTNVVVDARAPNEVVGVLQEALQSLEPDQAVAVEDFLVNAARVAERLERITELGEGDRVPVEHELEVLCAELFDTLGIDHNDELIRHFIEAIVSPDTLTITRDGTLSSLDIALLNYLGTNEYKGDEQASLLKTIMQAVRDWLRHQRWLGRCALKLASDASPARPMYSSVTI